MPQKQRPGCGRCPVKEMIYNLEIQAAREAHQLVLHRPRQSNPANIKQFCIPISKAPHNKDSCMPKFSIQSRNHKP